VKILKYKILFFYFFILVPFECFSKFALVSSNSFSHLLVEVAKTNNQKIKGLMFVKKLRTNGLLLLYDKPKVVNIWMKNTEIPLDIIFINNKKIISSIREGKPFSEKTISSKVPIIGVLEIPKDCVKKLNLNQGDRADWVFINNEEKKNIRYYHCLDDY
tara:strand:- start:5730 stop:6206 length:477 start_codon:yes stop_codon:yes gene_type:complete